MARFHIYVVDENNLMRAEVFQKILEEECKTFTISVDAGKVLKATKGTAWIAIFFDDKYIGYHYAHLVKFLQDEGLMLC